MDFHNRPAELRLARWGTHLAAALAMLVAAVLYFLLISRPMTTHSHRLTADIHRLEAMQQAALGAERTEAQLQQTLAAVTQRETTLLQRIPESAEEHAFLQAVTESAHAFDVQLLDYGRVGIEEQPTH